MALDPDDPDEPRADRPRRRTASRLVLAASFVLGVASFLVLLVPFDVALADGGVARCGPPLFELVVPPDPAFAVVEVDVCPGAARRRVALGAVGVTAAVVAAAVTERRARRGTSDAHAAWLAARPGDRRRARRERRAGGAEST